MAGDEWVVILNEETSKRKWRFLNERTKGGFV